MSTDYKAHTYRPELFKDTNGRTSYTKMHTWMKMKPREAFYNPPQFAGAQPPVHMQYYKSGGYDDFHKAALKQSRDEHMSQAFPTYNPTTIRNGQCGSGWKHVKEVQPAQANKQIYIDGQVKCDEKAYVKESPAITPHHVSPRRARNSGLPHDPNFTPRMIVLDREERLEKLEFEDIEAQKGIESRNWNLLR